MTIVQVQPTAPQVDTADPYRLVLFNGFGTGVFLRQEHGRWSFPEVQVRKFGRVIAEISEYVQQSWGINCSLLSSTSALSVDTFYVALEAPRNCEELQGLTKRQVSDASGLLDDREDVAFLESCLDLLNTEASCGVEPFTQLGWIYRVQDWVRRTPGMGELASFSQLSGSDDTCLIRFATSSKTLWYKAVGHSDPKEFSITSALSQCLPQYLPRILAFDQNLQAWLMENAGDSTLSDAAGFDVWVSTARRLAAMQIESINHASNLLLKGAADVRVYTLQSLVTPFFEVMRSLMQQQIKKSPVPLTMTELNDLAETLRDALTELAEAGVPDVIGHSDFNPGNILIGGDRSVFIDWSLAHVGPPTITLEYLIAHFKKNCAFLAGQDEIFRKAFREQWHSIIPDADFRRVQELSCLIAVFASAISDNTWSDSDHLALPGVSGYLRSLTRIMKREAKLLIQRRTLA